MSPSAEQCLPQYGFGSSTEFKTLVHNNRFIFRVYTPKSNPSPDSAFFTALKFDERYNHLASSASPEREPPRPTYADVARHMEWATRHTSPYVSASFSLMWAVWEAMARYHFQVKHDIEVAVIDAAALADRSATAVELLRLASPDERHRNHWKWCTFAQESQSVLVYGAIPPSAVLASVPLLRIINSLPSYCLRYRSPKHTHAAGGSPLDRVAWTYLSKPSYRRFCEENSALFLSAPHEIRFRDSTVGAVRLALAVLAVWFHRMLQLRLPHDSEGDSVNLDAAVAKLYHLARAIAVWPAGSCWTDVEREMRDSAIHAIVVLVAEQVRDTYRTMGSGETPHDETPQNSIEVITEDTSVSYAQEAKPDLPSSQVSTTVEFDPRNYLPTPPPSPSPSASPLLALTPVPSPETFLAPLISEPPQSPRTSSEELPEAPLYVEEDTTDDVLATIPEPSPPLSKPVPQPSMLFTPPSMGEAASCLLTGFFFEETGAFICELNVEPLY
ncbi:hypothetical protein B0H10DRAFT_2036011 [Mycena sp. CBHHK59/15]|nr:hypothetical protein B0H10DRAFT_2036011 [Mycena sp. CBHHK59/15]